MLGLSEREQELIHTAALLHDIGKFIFPDSILFADRKLTDDEWETGQAASRAGCEARPPDRGLRPCCRHHHQPPRAGRRQAATRTASTARRFRSASRIISVADTYDVMTSRDSYRRPVSTRGSDRPSCGASPAPSSTRWSSSDLSSDDLEERSCCVPSRRRGGLRARTGVRAPGRGLRATPRWLRPRHAFDSGRGALGR